MAQFSVPPLVDPLAQEDPQGYRQVLRNQFQRGLEVAVGDRQYSPMLGRRDYGLMPWESSAKKYGEPDIKPLKTPIAETASYGAGRLAGTMASDNLRSWYWRYNHPLAITADIGRSLPETAGNVTSTGRGKTVAAVLSGFGLATALDIFSGNTDPTNLAEGGRPKGYSALLPSVQDPTKSENLAVEIPMGYLTGRKGKLLPWDQFQKERPDVSPQQYQHYKDYQGWGKPGLFGLEQQDPLATATVGAGIGAGLAALKGRTPGGIGKAAATGAVAGLATPAAANLISSMGILKGTTNNLEGQPEAQLLGYKVPLTGALLTAGAGLGIYQLNKNAANRSKALYEQQKDSVRQAELKKLEERRRQVQPQVNRMEPHEKWIAGMSPQMADEMRSGMAPIQDQDFFANATPEMKKRIAEDEARRADRRIEMQNYYIDNSIVDEMGGKH
jgi:hypothetical protein